MNDKLSHYGIPRRSGRYPWGSGDDPQQRNKSFLGYVANLHNKGMSEVDIAKGLGMNVSQLRNKKSLVKAEQRKADVSEVIKLKTKGYSNVEIGKKMNINESSVRALLNPSIQERSEITNTVSNMLKESVNDKKYIDVGVGVERHIGVSRTKLKTAISQLEEEGYKIHYIPVLQLGTGKKTSIMVLSKSEIPYSEVYKNKDQIKMITDQRSVDGGRSFLGLEPIKNVDSKRIQIRYSEDGGSQKDGVIELRRDVDDISLGKNKYAQVRIGVDGSHYLKGMAIYSDDLPKGIDIIYNTNKKTGTPKEKVFKEMEKDPDNPFGTTIKAGGQRGALNIVNEEGDWGKWSNTISSQILSKQPTSLAKKQLGIAYDIKKEEFDEIMRLTNPTVRKKLLEAFSDDCDASAVHLKAAALPRQQSQVILPLTTIKENQIYAPNFKNGEKVVLIRHPHGGIFEIPELTVNNKNQEAGRLIKGAKDAVGINAKTAERLSGADFDGDTVLVIPNNNKLIKNSSPLKGLIDFDPKVAYPAYEGMRTMTAYGKGIQMGDISNLITDMTIKGANTNEIAKAVRHSMVVIDAEKHNLNYKKSYMDNGIGELKKRYQGSERSGATTLISKASSKLDVGLRKERIDPTTGKKIYEYTNETYINKEGKTIVKKTPSTKMSETEDAFTLSSGTPIESVYANHANKLKALANESRKIFINTPPITYSPSAKKIYESEVSSLNAKLNIALKNKPLERQAQLLANSIVDAKKGFNPNMDKSDLKKIKGQALTEARTRTNAKKQEIDITYKEWEAIQSGAISNNTLTQILNNTDIDKIKQLATPRKTTALTIAKQSKAKVMLSSGYTQSEVADALGVSISLISKLGN
jgi:DNA-binding CsgD family transcriptional regulator